MGTINDADGGYRLGGYREIAVPKALRDVAEVAWIYEGPAAGRGPLAGAGHRVIPETGASLCFASRRDADGRVHEPELMLMGPIRVVRLFRPEAGLHLAGIRIRPEWCRSLLRCDPDEHADGLDPLPRGARPSARLRARLAGTRSPEDAVTLLLEVLATASSERRPPDRAERLAHAALEAVRLDPTAGAPGSSFARRLGVSSRHLRRAVRAATGRGLKYFQRVRRLHHAVSMADRPGVQPTWATLAVRSGFFDQAHLIREVRELTGATPAELRAERARQQIGRKTLAPGA